MLSAFVTAVRPPRFPGAVRRTRARGAPGQPDHPGSLEVREGCLRDAPLLGGVLRGLVAERQVVEGHVPARSSPCPGHQLLLLQQLQVASDRGLRHARTGGRGRAPPSRRDRRSWQRSGSADACFARLRCSNVHLKGTTARCERQNCADGVCTRRLGARVGLTVLRIACDRCPADCAAVRTRRCARRDDAPRSRKGHDMSIHAEGLRGTALVAGPSGSPCSPRAARRAGGTAAAPTRRRA